MVFSSSVFLFAFLPICLAIYFILPWRPAKNVVLLLFSLVFYAWGEPIYIWLMIVSIAINYSGGRLLGAKDETSSDLRRYVVLLILLFANLGILGFFKYWDFLAEGINGLAGYPMVPVQELPLPIGISFYTLQAITYIVDVYRGEAEPQKNPLYLGMYIAMFPQLVAGPIIRYEDVWKQITGRKETLRKFCSGVRLFCIGIAKKVLLANVCAILAESMFGLGGERVGVVGAWAGLIAFSFQILFDFGGYSDMAIGLGKMFGFEYKRNFNYPYISRSISEFWRRWHIALGSFFRDYVYIPLGGNRVNKTRWAFNLFVVWALTGLWHGAAINFVLWGLYYGLFIAVEKLWLGDVLRKAPRLFQHLYTVIIFMFGWVLFCIEDPVNLANYFLAMFGAYGVCGTSTFWELQAWSYLPVFAACLIACTPIVPWVRDKMVAFANRGCENICGPHGDNLPLYDVRSLSSVGQCDCDGWIDRAISMNAPRSRLLMLQIAFFLADLACLLMLVLSVMAVVSGSYDPFIYFRF